MVWFYDFLSAGALAKIIIEEQFCENIAGVPQLGSQALRITPCPVGESSRAAAVIQAAAGDEFPIRHSDDIHVGFNSKHHRRIDSFRCLESVLSHAHKQDAIDPGPSQH